MAVSEVSICNNAIAILAANRITALADGSQKESILCGDLYDQARDETLEGNEWTFATARVQLSASSETVPGYTYKAVLPGTVMKVAGVWEDPTVDRRGKYVREGNTIRTNFSPVYVKYVYQEKNPVLFSALFIKALYYNLASKLCVPLTEDQKRQEVLEGQAQFFLDDAAASDGVQGSQERVTSDAFIRVR